MYMDRINGMSATLKEKLNTPCVVSFFLSAFDKFMASVEFKPASGHPDTFLEVCDLVG